MRCVHRPTSWGCEDVHEAGSTVSSALVNPCTIENPVIVATIAVWAFGSAWPDLVVALGLLALFTKSAARVIGAAWRQMLGGAPASA